jgi:hypothetical protein
MTVSGEQPVPCRVLCCYARLFSRSGAFDVFSTYGVFNFSGHNIIEGEGASIANTTIGYERPSQWSKCVDKKVNKIQLSYLSLPLSSIFPQETSLIS